MSRNAYATLWSRPTPPFQTLGYTVHNNMVNQKARIITYDNYQIGS